MTKDKPDTGRVEEFFQKLRLEAERSGYYLNPDESFTRDLVEALLINLDRYGYLSCPCRLAEGDRNADLDIICPCDYRDSDLFEFGSCYCALYISEEIARREKEAEPIPERRLSKEERGKADAETRGRGDTGKDLSYPVYRCKVCGYLCARDEPPGKCPVCGAEKDRFERFM
jgi:ferredoxin-thioredoxin reductase catalytic subunit/rubredoxin